MRVLQASLAFRVAITSACESLPHLPKRARSGPVWVLYMDLERKPVGPRDLQINLPSLLKL